MALSDGHFKYYFLLEVHNIYGWYIACYTVAI